MSTGGSKKAVKGRFSSIAAPTNEHETNQNFKLLMDNILEACRRERLERTSSRCEKNGGQSEATCCLCKNKSESDADLLRRAEKSGMGGREGCCEMTPWCVAGGKVVPAGGDGKKTYPVGAMGNGRRF
jgi:hypothetical protein